MFATYSESVPLFFFFFQVNVFRCVWGRDIFTITSLLFTDFLFFKTLLWCLFFLYFHMNFFFYCLKYWCRFLNENLADPHTAFIEHVMLYCNLLSNPIIHCNLHWTVST